MKNKFEFESKDKIIEENKIEIDSETEELSEEERLKELKIERRNKIKKFSLIILFHLIGSLVIIALGLIWQDSYDVMAWSNATLLSFIMVFFVGWIMFIHNKNIISVFTHSLKTFGLMLVGKRPDKNYYEVKTEIEDNPIPNVYLIITFLFSIVLLVVTIILTILAL